MVLHKTWTFPGCLYNIIICRIFTYKNEIRMMTENQKRTRSRCTLKEAYCACNYGDEWCSLLCHSSNEHILINKWKGRFYKGFYLHLNGFIWVYLEIVVQAIYYNPATQASIRAKQKAYTKTQKWLNIVLLGNWVGMKNSSILYVNYGTLWQQYQTKFLHCISHFKYV